MIRGGGRIAKALTLDHLEAATRSFDSFALRAFAVGKGRIRLSRANENPPQGHEDAKDAQR